MNLRKSLAVKAVKPTSKIKSNESYTDFLCPICLQILIEPVQMPCKHELCMECFQTHVSDTSLTCPMCRLRISIWVRQNRKSNTLVHEKRWQLIKDLFPERVKRRLDGLDDLETSYNEYNAPVHVICPDGDLRKEYEEELKKVEKENEEISKVSLDFIRKFRQDEQLEREKQEEMDRAAALDLQQEEMEQSGVQLKSPTLQQEKLLALFKPKSPMKLRKRVISGCGKSCVSPSTSSIKNNDISSPSSSSKQKLRSKRTSSVTVTRPPESKQNKAGVQLKSPTLQQEKLLALFKPKSPMKLRKRVISGCGKSCVSPSTSSIKNNDISSPSSSSKKKVRSKRTSSVTVIRPPQSKPNEAGSNDSDFKLAKKLQGQFEVEFEVGSPLAKRPLMTKHSFENKPNDVSDNVPINQFHSLILKKKTKEKISKPELNLENNLENTPEFLLR